MRLRWKLLTLGLLSAPGVLHDSYHMLDYATNWHARDIPVLGFIFGPNEAGFLFHAIVVGSSWVTLGTAVVWLIWAVARFDRRHESVKEELADNDIGIGWVV